MTETQSTIKKEENFKAKENFKVGNTSSSNVNSGLVILIIGIISFCIPILSIQRLQIRENSEV